MPRRPRLRRRIAELTVAHTHEFGKLTELLLRCRTLDVLSAAREHSRGPAYRADVAAKTSACGRRWTQPSVVFGGGGQCCAQAGTVVVGASQEEYEAFQKLVAMDVGAQCITATGIGVAHLDEDSRKQI